MLAVHSSVTGRTRCGPKTRRVDVSIVIPARDESANITALLESLASLDLGSRNVEIIVYDDASTDRTVEAVESLADRISPAAAKIRLIRGIARVGCAGAVAQLIAQARGDAIVRMNADVAPCDGAVQLLVESLEAGAGLAIAAQSPQLTRLTVAALASSFAFDVVERLKAGRFRHHYAVGHLVGVRRALLDGLEFPNDIINEDHFLAMHVVRRGGTVVYVPQARCRVNPASTFADYWRVSRRVLEGERQLRREHGVERTPFHVLAGAVLQSAARKPVHGACWAALYPLSSSLPTPARNSAWDTVRSTKGRIA